MSQILVAETNRVLSQSCCVSVDGGMGLCSHLGMSYSLEPGMTGIPMGADGGFLQEAFLSLNGTLLIVSVNR